MAENSTAVQSILKDLNAGDPKIVLEAITKSRKDGNAKTLEAMLAVLKETDEPLVESKIIEFLFDLKVDESVSILIAAVQDEEMVYYQNFLVSAFWQSAIDGSDYLDVFVKTAISGEYLTTLEALTVIENFDRAYPQSELLELETDILEAIEKEINEDKKTLLVSLADVVRNLPIEGE